MANGSCWEEGRRGARKRRADRPPDPLALVRKDSTYVYDIGQGHYQDHYVEVGSGKAIPPKANRARANRGRDRIEGQFYVACRGRPASPGRFLPGGVCGTLSYAAYHAGRAFP